LLNFLLVVFVVPRKCYIVAFAISILVLCLVLKDMFFSNICFRCALSTLSLCLAHLCNIVVAITIIALANLCLFVVLLGGFGSPFLGDLVSFNACVSSFCTIKVDYNSISLLSGLMLCKLVNPFNSASAINEGKVSGI
jgi:hypothetical protein